MVLASAVDVVKNAALPIGIVIGAVVILAVPQFRRAVFESFHAGHQAGAKFGKRDSDRENK